MKGTKKSQVKMGENIAILLVFFLLLGLGLIFYWVFFRQSAEKESTEIFDMRTIEIYQKIFFLPELQCTDNNIVKDGCIDIIKAMALKKYLDEYPDERVFYYNIFGFSDVTIIDIETTEEVTIYSNTIENTSKSKTRIPVLIYNPIQSKYDFGVAEIIVYRK